MEFGKLGTTLGETNVYDEFKNPLLEVGVPSANQWGLVTGIMAPRWYAKPLIAQVVAQAVGGSVVTYPWQSFMHTPGYTMLGIKVGENAPVIAGVLCDILGNDAYYSTARLKSGAICEALGVAFDPGLADKLFNAVLPFIPVAA